MEERITTELNENSSNRSFSGVSAALTASNNSESDSHTDDYKSSSSSSSSPSSSSSASSRNSSCNKGDSQNNGHNYYACSSNSYSDMDIVETNTRSPCISTKEQTGQVIRLDCKDNNNDLGTIKITDLMENQTKGRQDSPCSDFVGERKSNRLAHKTSFCNKKIETQIKKSLRTLLTRSPTEWTDDDRTTIQSFPKFVSEVEKHLQKKRLAFERTKELEDSAEVLESKCALLASAISHSRYLVVYTGAGISTSAKIPDYRGPNGIWTLLQKGEQLTQSLTSFSQTADPTFTHMAIKELWSQSIVKHVVSQNVDGLHLRSGIPKTALSEVHGNMYVEVCVKCGREFVRLFDVTENTRRYRHKTGRFCYNCGNCLKDSIVLFGEKGSLRWPLNWTAAEYHVGKADTILCLGSSLKVLRRYPWLWSMSRPAVKRPKLYIVNLQWTPKDRFATLKINGKCDEVTRKVLGLLNISVPPYERHMDAIFTVATKLHQLELDTKSSSELSYPHSVTYPEKNNDLQNYIRFEPIFKVPFPYENVNVEFCIQLGAHNNDSNSCKVSNVKCRESIVKKRIRKGTDSSWVGNSVTPKQKKRKK